MRPEFAQALKKSISFSCKLLRLMTILLRQTVSLHSYSKEPQREREVNRRSERGRKGIESE